MGKCSDRLYYTAWHSARGSVQPQSFQPYLSSINTAHRHVLGESGVPEGGGLLGAVRRGWLREHLAKPGVQKDVTTALPARTARVVLELFKRSDAAPALDARAFTFLIVSFATLMRASSAVPLADTDVVDEPAEVRVCPRRIKGGQLSVLLPIPKVFPAAAGSLYMRSVVRRWRAVRTRAWGTARLRPPGAEEPGSFWALPGDSHSLAAAASVATAWVEQALSLAGIKASPRVQYTSKCNRKGGASAAFAEGVSMEAIWALGDWAIGSTTPSKHYIDAAVRRDEHSTFFFGFRAMQRR